MKNDISASKTRLENIGRFTSIPLTTKFALVLLYATCVALAVQHGGLLDFMMNSDQMTIPSLADDFLYNPKFFLSTWSLPRAPYLFPDGVVVLFLRSISHDVLWIVVTCIGIYTLALIIGTGLILRRIFDEAFPRFVAMLSFLVGLSLYLTFIQQYSYFLVLPISHAGPFLVGLFLISTFLEAKGRLVWAALTALSALSVFSDRFFMIYFSAPYVFTIILFDRTRWFTESAKAAASQVLAGLLGHALLAWANTQITDPIVWDLFSHYDLLVAAVGATSPWPWLIYALALILGFGFVVRALLLRLGMYGAEGVTTSPYVVYVSSSALASAAVTFLLWSSPDISYLRYGVPFQYLPIFLLAYFPGKFLRNVGRSVPTLAFYVVALIPLFVLLERTFSFDNLSARAHAQAKLVTELIACKKRFGLKAGVADYWLAKRLTMATNWALQINQLTPWNPREPFYWGSNLLWFYFDARSGKPIEYNFIISNSDAQDPPLETLYGVPSRTVHCAGHELLIYEDVGALTSRIVGRLFFNQRKYTVTNRPLFTTVSKDGPQPLAIFAGKSLPSIVGQVDDSRMVADGQRDNEGMLTYGPYLNLPKGDYIVEFDLICKGSMEGSYADVTSDAGRTAHARIELRNVCFGAHQKAVDLHLSNAVSNVEFRLYFGGKGILAINSVSVRLVGGN